MVLMCVPACLQVNTSPHLVLLDVGMVAELDPGDQQNLVGFFKARACTTHSVAAACGVMTRPLPGLVKAKCHHAAAGMAGCIAAPLTVALHERLKTSHRGLLVQALTSQDGEALGHNILDFSDNQTCPVGHSPPLPSAAAMSCC